MAALSALNKELATSPLHVREILMKDPKSACRLPEHGSPTILVIEDNDIVRDFLQDTFHAYGYRTLIATNREQALEHCRRDGDTIHTLIADVRLGNQDGFAIARTLKQICPEMKIVLMSGYPYEHLVQIGILPAFLGDVAFLQKPFPPSEIMSVLNLARHLA